MRNPFTSRHIKYWKSRSINWAEAYFTPDHPHRNLIIKALERIPFGSVIEIGCGAGANLWKIKQSFPHAEVGGIDISKEAIDACLEKMPNEAVFEVSDATRIFLSDKSADVVLSDMCLIYMDPFNIGKAIKEIKRVARNNVLFVEFHSSSWWKRQALRLLSGYNAYDYKTLLEDHGFYDIEFYKLKESDWPGGNPQKDFAYVISART